MMRHVGSVFFFIFIFSQFGMAQISIEAMKLAKDFSVIEEIKGDVNKDNFFENYKEAMGTDGDSEFVLAKVLTPHNGFAHYKYDQVYKGIPIYGTTYVLHESEGELVNATGSYYPLISDLSVSPSINKGKALAIAKEHMAAKLYSEARISEIQLYIVDAALPKISGDYRLSYRVEVESMEPYDKRDYFVDALSGEVIHNFPLVHAHSVEGVLNTMYYGDQTVVMDSVAPGKYVLFDETRGNDGIKTSDTENFIYSNGSNYWDWSAIGREQAALDAHWSTEQFYDMMEEYFEWPGLDGEGKSMNCRMLPGTVVNAFWNGTDAAFGQGNCAFNPLTNLEIVAHEFTHGVTDETSDLIYSQESGAINESMSDVFGKALELRSDPDRFNWYIAQSILINGGDPFRSMVNPNELGDPAHYKGSFWTDGAGVHTNSSIGNHWFYGLVEGEVGINEDGIAYQIGGLGMDTAIQIVFRTQMAYLTENSNYNEYYRYSVLAAQELYGVNSYVVEDVRQAWTSVGLPYENTGPLNLDFIVYFEETAPIIFTCHQNENLGISLYLTNQGPSTYYPENFAAVELSIDEEIENFLLEDTVVPGQTVIINSNMLVNDSKTYEIIADLAFPDNNLFNNRHRYRVNNTIMQIHDLVLEASTPSTVFCDPDEVRINMNIQNRGCTLPAGSEIKAYFEVEGELIDSFSYTTQVDLIHSRRINLSSLVDMSQVQDSIDVRLESVGDPNVNNGKGRVGVNFIDSDASIGYKNTFDDSTALEDGIVFTSSLNTRVVEYQGESYLASSGFLPIVTSICDNNPLDVYEFITGSKGRTTVFEMCVNLADAETIQLEFDLTQFKNEDIAQFERYDSVLTMLRVTYTGTGQGGTIIYNQPVGEQVHHTINLPDRFVGSILFEFVNITGIQIVNNPDSFINYDVNLLDNLELSARTVSTKEEANSKLSMFPNPVSDVLTIQSENQIAQVEIYSTSGILAYSSHNMLEEQQIQLDLSSLVPGYYVIRLIDSEGISQAASFVKQ